MPDGPREFYRESLQTRSELVDSMTFVVDEQSARELFVPVAKRFDQRTNALRDQFDEYDKKTGMKNQWMKLNRQDSKIESLNKEVIPDMINAIKEYERFCRDLAYVNVRLSREMKRIDLILQASMSKKMDGGGNAKPADFPSLSLVLDKGRTMQGSVPRIFPAFTGGEAERFAENLKKLGDLGIDTKFVAMFNPQALDAPLAGFEAPPPPAAPDWAANSIKQLVTNAQNAPPLAGNITLEASGAPRKLAIKNTTGGPLSNVNGRIFYKVGARKDPVSYIFEAGSWAKDDARTTEIQIDQGVVEIRLVFTADQGGKTVGFDKLLGDPPPPGP
jgi:hypothetical protein